jgi:hypothetical protein
MFGAKADYSEVFKREWQTDTTCGIGLFDFFALLAERSGINEEN